MSRIDTYEKLNKAKSIMNKKKTIEEELRYMFTKEQLCFLLGSPVSEKDFPIGISKTKLARALVLKWKVEKDE